MQSRPRNPSNTRTQTHPGARPLPPEVRDVLYQELVGIAIELDEMPEGSYGRRLDLRERQAQVRRLLLDDATATSADDADENLLLHDDQRQTIRLDGDPLVLRDPEPRVMR